MKLGEDLFWLVVLVVVGLVILCAFDGLDQNVALEERADERIAELEARITDLEARVERLALLCLALGEQVGQLPSDENLPTGAEAAAALATEDIATRLGIHPTNVRVVEVVRATWQDGCLGVPDRGPCLQATTYGFRITLEAADRLWRYHSDLEGARVVYVGPVTRELFA